MNGNCKFPFAPGVIVTTPRRSVWRTLRRWLRAAFGAVS